MKLETRKLYKKTKYREDEISKEEEKIQKIEDILNGYLEDDYTYYKMKEY